MTRTLSHKMAHFCLAITLGLTALSFNNMANATEERIDYLKIQQEERAWAGLTSKTLRVGDIAWTYSEGGNIKNPTILLLHGLGSNRDSWNKIAHDLTPYFHVVIPDLPSSNKKLFPAEYDLSLNNVTEQLRRFIETASIQNNLNIAGHSIGGSLALFYASKYPEDTKSLLLMSIGGPFNNSNTVYLKNPVYLKQLIVSKPGDYDYVMKTMMSNPPFIPGVIKKEQEKALIAESEENSKVINEISNINQYYNKTAFNKMLANTQAPTLIIWGKQDKIANVEIATELKSKLKKAEMPIVLEHVGHVPVLEADQLIIQNYLPFLRKVNNLPTP